jgi:hypothetical protein
MRSTPKNRIAAAAALAAAVVGVAAGPANAITIPKQVDPIGASTHRAAMAGLVTLDQDLGATAIKGKVSGLVTYNAPIADFKAGCARVKVLWRNAAGDTIADDLSGQACSSNGLFPSAVSMNETYTNANIRSVRVRLQVKQFGQSSYTTVATRTVHVGS